MYGGGDVWVVWWGRGVVWVYVLVCGTRVQVLLSLAQELREAMPGILGKH